MNRTRRDNAFLTLGKRVIGPFSIGTIALAVAYIGAVLTGDGITGANALVEDLSGESRSRISQLSLWLPVGFAFGAGMVSTFNPCGFVMLPVYLGLYLGSTEENEVYLPKLLVRALVIGSSVTLGFMLLFGLAGIIIGVGSQVIVGLFPWIGLCVGVALTVLGAWLLQGGTLYTNLAERAASRIGESRQLGIKGYFLFGISFATASISCTLPIFLLVVTSTFVVSGFLAACVQFIAYALGMGSILMAVTLGIALFKGTAKKTFRQVSPYIAPLSAVLILFAGTYIVYYWLTLGDLLESFPTP